jgi:hypothetical protein
MPNKLTDTEIKKALELCQLEDSTICETCPLGKLYPYCDDVLAPATVDLINRLETKNSNLTSDLSSLQNDLTSAKAEVERLRLKIENKIEEIYPLVMQLPNVMQQAKAEAYKECIEKVKAENYDRCIDVVYDGSGEVKRVEIRQALLNKQLDNLLNEFERKENTTYDD